MLQWLPAIALTLAIGGVATWLAHGPLRRRGEAAAGIAALSAMSWREFIHLVLQALARRGYHRRTGPDAPAGDDDYVLVRDGEQHLLAAKHGSAFVLGRQAVGDLESSMRLAGASGGLLVTQGRINEDARAAARGRPIELLDGRTLWPELRPIVPEDVARPIRTAAANRARQQSLAGWLLALLAGVAVFAATPEPQPPPAVAAASALPATAASVPAVEDAVPGAADEASLEDQQRELARAVSTLPMVARVQWNSGSTMEVFVLGHGAEEDPFAAICPLVLRYPALAPSRIQVTPPPDSGRQVRFRQCRSY